MTTPVEFATWIPDGFQVRKIRRPRKDCPEWVANEESFRRALFLPAIRRYRIAYLYWRCGWSAREVAEELGITTNAVEQAVKKLTKRS